MLTVSSAGTCNQSPYHDLSSLQVLMALEVLYEGVALLETLATLVTRVYVRVRLHVCVVLLLLLRGELADLREGVMFL